MRLPYTLDIEIMRISGKRWMRRKLGKIFFRKLRELKFKKDEMLIDSDRARFHLLEECSMRGIRVG